MILRTALIGRLYIPLRPFCSYSNYFDVIVIGEKYGIKMNINLFQG